MTGIRRISVVSLLLSVLVTGISYLFFEKLLLVRFPGVSGPERREGVDLFSSLIYGFSVALQPSNLLFCFIGVFLGTLVGVLPGIGPVGTIALLLPLTFKLSPVTGIIMLAGIYYGSMYGGSTTSILINIPGETSSVVTCLDGYQMALQGRAGPALGIAAFGSFIAGSVGLAGLVLHCQSSG